MNRCLALWFPDWSLLAARVAHDLGPDTPVALTDRGRVHACSPTAAAEGVTLGLRLREAQNRCPQLTVLPHDPVRDEQLFEPVVRTVDEVVPGVDVRRPGLVAVRVSGAARFYGSEAAAATALAAQVRGVQKVVDLRIGIADGTYAAELAARRTRPAVPLRVIPPGQSKEFLAGLPLDVLDDQELLAVLRRLGLSTLGEFAALPGGSVRARFGTAGQRAHALASGLEVAPLVPTEAPPDLTREVVFEPGLERVDQVAFGCRTLAEEFVATLTARQLVCSEVRVVVFTDDDAYARSERVWTHPRQFTSAELVDRIRWQLQGAAEVEAPMTAGVVRVEIEPVTVDAASAHASGLWGDGPDDRIHHTATRLQGRLGQHGVLAASLGGGRLLAERRLLRPWGEALPRERRVDQPWPGSVPGLAPSLVFEDPPVVRLLDATGAPVRVTERGELSGEPAVLDGRAVQAWAGPWPVRQRWWDPAAAQRLDRVQLVDDHDDAWLLIYEDNIWRAEAQYD